MRLALGGGHSTFPAVSPGVSGAGGASGTSGVGGSPVSMPSGASSESVYIVCHDKPL
jgi:hypothetical protein